MAEKTTDLTQRDTQRLGRRERWSGRPMSMLERFADEIDSVFGDFGWGRTRGLFGSGRDIWAPAVEVSQQNNELVVRADLPGLKKEDVSIDVTDNDLTISGERRQEHETERGGVYRSERSYGSFYRTIPLPDGAMTDQAKATFKDGVLEIRMPAPPEQVTRGRRLEIRDASEPKK
jgi:HSP20 family protein